jgi:hypothetical protein
MKLNRNLSNTTWLFAAIASAGMGLAASAQVQTEAKSGMRVVSVESADGDTAENHTYEIRIENGKVTVRKDGKEVPDSEIRNQDGRVTITDAHGQPLDLMLNADGDVLRSYLGGGDTQFNWAGNLANEKPPKIMLGVHMGEPGPALEYHLKLDPGTTTMIVGVYEGLPAEQAGLSQYDVIVKVDGESPANPAAVKEILSKKDAGDAVTFDVIHEGKAKQVKIKLAKYDADAMKKAKLIGQGPQDQYWTWTKGSEIDPKAFEGMYKRFLVAPGADGKNQWELIAPSLKPLIEGRVREAERYKSGDLDEQLQRLDKRMDDLENMLQKLIDREQRNR